VKARIAQTKSEKKDYRPLRIRQGATTLRKRTLASRRESLKTQWKGGEIKGNEIGERKTPLGVLDQGGDRRRGTHNYLIIHYWDGG